MFQKVRAAAPVVGLMMLGALPAGVAIGDDATGATSSEVRRAAPRPSGAPRGASGHGHSPGGEPDSHHGHHDSDAHAHAPLPADYRSEHVPAAAWTSAALIARGRDIYAAKCAVCHGERGDGKGPAAAGLPLEPPDLRSPMVNEMSGSYWFWRVSEGGAAEPFRSRGSAMPAWKHDLSAEDRWAVIVYQHTFSGHHGPHVGSEHAELLGTGHDSRAAQVPGSPAKAARPHAH